MRNRLLVAASLLALVMGARPAAAQATKVVVIVNASNATTELTNRELSRIFRKEVTRWNDGSTILPVDLPERAPARAEFTQRVHGKPTQAIVAYWQQQIFSGRSVPPVERKNDAEVIEYVRTHPGAVGYVAAGTPLPSEVKSVAVR